MKTLLTLLLAGVMGFAQITTLPQGGAAGAGDVTGVTAGDGISGGGASGGVTVTNAAPLYACTDTGGDDTYACTPAGFPGSYSTGITLRIRMTTANTGAATIDAGPGAKAIKLPDGTTNPSNGDVVALKPMLVTYDSTADGGSGAWILATGGSGGTGNAAATEAVTYGATPTFTMTSNTRESKTMTLTGNVTNCTLAAATAAQEISLILTASTSTRTFACASITNLGTLSIASGVTCTITIEATSASAAFVKGPISCPNGNQLTFVAGGTAEVTFPTGTYSVVASGALATKFVAHDTGGDDTYVVATPTSGGSCPSALADGLTVEFVADTTNTGSATLDFCGLGALEITAATAGTDLTNGDLVVGKPYLLRYYDAATDLWLVTLPGAGGGVTFTTPYLVNSGSYYYPGMYSAATLPSAATWGSIGATNTWTAVGDTYTLHTDAPGGNGVNMAARRDTATLASGDFTVTAFLVGCWNPAMEVVQDSGCGMTLYDGTKYVSWGLSGNSSSKGVLSYDYYTNATTMASRNQINGNFYYSTVGLIGFRIAKVSGNLAFYVSLDGGLKWITAASGVSCTAHFASCASLNAGVYANPTWTGAFAETTLVSWLEQ